MSKILKRAIKNLKKKKDHVKISRDQWLNQAVLAEQADSMVTCRAIIHETMELGLDIDAVADQAER